MRWTGFVFLVACSPAPQWVAVAGDGRVALYDAKLGMADSFATERDTGAHIAFDPGGTTMLLLTASAEGSMVTRLSRLTGVVTERRQVPGAPITFVVGADGTILVATADGGIDDDASGRLHVLSRDLATAPVRMVSVCSAPLRDLHYWEDAREVFALCADGTVVELDARLWVRVRAEAVLDRTCDPQALTMSANGTLLLVLCGAGRLQYIDRVRLAVIDSMQLGAGGRGIARTPDGRRAMISMPERDAVVTVDLRRRTVDRLVRIREPGHVTASGDGRTAYVVSGAPPDRSEVMAIDLASLQVVRRATAPFGARNVAVWPAGRSPTMRWSAGTRAPLGGRQP